MASIKVKNNVYKLELEVGTFFRTRDSDLDTNDSDSDSVHRLDYKSEGKAVVPRAKGGGSTVATARGAANGKSSATTVLHSAAPKHDVRQCTFLRGGKPAEGAVPRGLPINNDTSRTTGKYQKRHTTSAGALTARGRVGLERRQPSPTPVRAPQPPPLTLHQPPPPETSRTPSIASPHS
ncbi:UNVERIFIED_CONTAM: hypothetical protein FKN15_005075 [Acipenser sinensis]